MNVIFPVASPELEYTDPNPDIYKLLREYDVLFFDSILLKHCVQLDWCKRMTRTAGLCGWDGRTG